MIDLSQATAIAAITIPLAAIVVTVIKVRGLSPQARPPGQYCGDPRPKAGQNIICGEHSGVASELKSLHEGQIRIEGKMDANFKTIFDKMDKR